RGQLDEHPATARRVSRCLPVNRLAAALGAARGRHAPPRGRPLNSRIPRRYPGAAMPRADHYPDPEDYFAETRMSFGDHIEDLRTHLIRAIAGFVIGMIIAFSFGMWVFHFITAPVEWEFALHEAQRVVGRPPLLSTLNVMEGFMVYIKVCAFTGLVISSPWVFWQIWAFIAAGLYPHEKKYVHKYLPISLGLFLAGVLLCEFMVIPKAIQALLWFNEWLGLEPDLRLNEWLSFALLLPLVFGLSFQTPMVML